jgi:YVTN family beta-propeller protein
MTIPTWPNVAPAPAVTISSAGARAYLPQTMAHGQGLNTQFDNTVFPKVSVLNLETQEHQTSEHISLPETDQPVGLPWDVALARSDSELWVVNAGSNDISVVDITEPRSPRRSAHITVGHNPRGIAIHPDGHTAYVNNTLSGTVSVIDTSAYTVTSVITVTEIPLPPVLLSGKRLFHSSARPELAQARWISCNTCHIEGEQDGRTWLLQYTGEVPVGAQPIITRNTTSLLGMIETYPLRWSAEWDESADSEFSIRFEQFGTGLIDGPMHPTLGPPNQGRSWDLDSLAAFVDSLQVPERSHPLSEAEQRGLALFQSPRTGCMTCHPAPLYTDLKQHDVGTADSYGEWFGPLIDTPTLRFLYDSAPYLHDGSAATLHEVLVTDNPQDPHGMASLLTEQEIEDLVAYLLALPHSSEEAAFTYQASSCLGEPTRTDGRIELWVEGCDILMTHRDAVYNCCAQVVVYPEWQGTLLKLVEQEEYPDREPCRCVCRIDLGARLADLRPGTYTVQVWDGVAEALLAEETVIVEAGCGGRDRSRFTSTMRSIP